MQDFWAAEASFRFILLTYNLMALFRHVARQDTRIPRGGVAAPRIAQQLPLFLLT
jgi:hypothetical protein